MKKNPLPTNRFRQQAEDILKGSPPVSRPLHSEADTLKLIRELEIHRLELELQNEELTKAQAAMQDAVRLYDSSPTGYFTLSIDGEISGLNQSGANMLHREKENLTGSRFGLFVSEETKPIFNDFLEQIYKNKTVQTCEIALHLSENETIYATLTGVLADNQECCLITAINTTDYKQQKEKLHHERELYQDIVNNQPAGIYRIKVIERDKWWNKSWLSSENPPYSMELASDRFCEILGITREEFETNPAIISDLIHPDDKSIFSVKNEEANTLLVPFQWEGQLVVHNKLIWVHLESIPRPTESGEVLWTGILYDITDQKKAEAALKESENKYRKLVDNSPDAISIYSDGKIVFVNNACLDLIRATSAEELLGKSVLEFVHPDSLHFARERMKDVIQKGKALPSEEEKFICLDGTTIDVEVKAMPIVFQNNTAVQLIIRDITDRKRAEKEINKSKEDFKDLFNNAPLGYHEIDSEGRVVRINQTELTMLGYTSEDLIGQYIWKYNTNEKYSFEITREKLQGRLISATPYERELLRKDGSTITVLQFDRILQAKDGNITGIRSSVQDITERKQAEINLQLSEEKFRNIFENSIVGKSMTTIDGQMKVNKAFSNILGYSEEELSHMKWIDLTYQDDIEFNTNEIKSILIGEKDFSQWQKRYIHKNGNIIWANISTFLLRDNDGNPMHFITEIFDITDSKKSEEDLRNSEEKFKKAFMTSPDSVTINRMHDGMYVSTNIGFTRILGYEQGDILGKTSLDANIWVNYEDRDRFVAELSKKGIVENFMTHFRSKSGETVYGLVSASVIELKGINHILSITRDITAIKKTELALQQSQERFKVLFEDAPDSMFLADPETGMIIDANMAACRLFKMTKEELVGQYQHDLHPKDHNELSNATFKDHIIQSEIKDVTSPLENKIVCSDGTVVPVEILAHSITIDDKVLMLGTFRDITERKKAEVALRESEELYHGLVLRIPDGVYKSSADGKFIDVNPAMVRMFGYESNDELLNIDIPSQLYFDPADREHVLPDGQKEEISVFPLKKKDGSVIWIEDHGWYNADPDGKVVTHEGVLRDVTERKLAQDALLERESILKKTLIESTGLIDNRSEAFNFEKISDTILEISGAKYVSFNIFDDSGSGFTTVSVSGIKEDLLEASSYFGYEVINKKWKFDPSREEKTKGNSITRFESFSELNNSLLSEDLLTFIENKFNIGDCFVIKVTKNNISIGDFTLIYSKGETLRNNELVLLFANQVALYLDRNKTDKALRINEEKYRYLFANNPQPMYIYDVETLAFLEVNQAAIDQYGYSKEEFLGMSLKDIRPPEDIPALLLDVQNKNEKFKPAGIWRHTKKNGEIIFVDITTVSVTINGMNARHVLIQDITERKRAEEALRESEDKYRTMIENSNDMIWTLDESGNFTFLNKIALQTTGLELNEWLGKSFTPLVLNEDLPMITDVFNSTMHGEVCTYELRFKKEDETILTILVNTSPINISGKIVGIVSFGRDITESKESLRMLLESEEKFRSITEQTGDLISITDTNGIIQYASKASKSIFQYEPDEMCGHLFTDFVEEKSIPEAIIAFQDSLESSLKVKNKEFNMKRKDGTIFCGELNGSKFKNGDNNGTLVVIRDMSERKKVQEELEEKMNDLIRFQNLTVDREITMIELKKEVNELLLKSGQKLKYNIVK